MRGVSIIDRILMDDISPFLLEEINQKVKDGELLDKDGIEELVARAGLPLFSSAELSGISSYRYLKTDPSDDPEQFISAIVDAQDDFVIGTWHFEEPLLEVLPAGAYVNCVSTERTSGTRTVRLFFTLVEIDPNDGSIVWESDESDLSGAVTVRERQTMTDLLTERREKDDESHKFGMRLYARGTSGGSDTTVGIYVEGGNRCHLRLPITTAILETIFSRNPHDMEEDHETSETDTDKVLTPDGVGGVEWGDAEGGADNSEILWVSKEGDDTTADGTVINPFLTIKGALDYVDSVFTPSPTERYIILVPRGLYVEDNSTEPITIHDYVTVVGLDSETTIITGTNNENFLFKTDDVGTGKLIQCTLSGLDGTGGGGFLINSDEASVVIPNLNIVDCTKGLEVSGNFAYIVLDTIGIFNCGVGIEVSGMSQVFANGIQILTTGPPGTPASGTGVLLSSNDCAVSLSNVIMNLLEIGIEGTDNGGITLSSVICRDAVTGIRFAGDGMRVINHNSMFVDGTTHFEYVNEPNTYDHTLMATRYDMDKVIRGEDATIDIRGIGFDTDQDRGIVYGNLLAGQVLNGNYVELDEVEGLIAYGTARGRRSISTQATEMRGVGEEFNDILCEASTLFQMNTSARTSAQVFDNDPFDDGVACVFTTALPSDYQAGTDIDFVLSWTRVLGNLGDEVVWQVGIANVKAENNYDKSLVYKEVVDEVPTGNEEKQTLFTFEGVPEEMDLEPDDMLLVVILRHTDDFDDTLGGDAYVPKASISYISNRLGGTLE